MAPVAWGAPANRQVRQWWPVQDPVPYALEEEDWKQGKETIELFSTFAWLKPPKGGPPSPSKKDKTSDGRTVVDFEHDIQLYDEYGRQVLENLRRWFSEGGTQTRAEQLAQGLATFAKEALEAFSKREMTEEDRRSLLPEARRLIAAMTRKDFISIEKGDLNMILHAFDYEPTSRYWSARQLEWWVGSMRELIKEILNNSPGHDWEERIKPQLTDEDSSLYKNVDVRAWSDLRHHWHHDGKQHHLVKEELLQHKPLCQRLRTQLCMSGPSREEKLHDLEDAAKILTELKLHRAFNPEGSNAIYDTFNDSTLNLERRTKMVKDILKDAPRRLVREVLRKMDEDLDENERWEDTRSKKLQEVLYHVDEDIRVCKKAYLKLMRTWIRNVVEHEELMPDQLCEHIEGDGQEEDNYEVLLKDAVNYLHKNNRTFEAAKMLSRPMGLRSRIKESLRNDVQIEYLVSLYQEVKEIPDHFGPVAEGSMALPEFTVHRLPGKQGEVFVNSYAEDEGFVELEQVLKLDRPDAIGIWWLWRCFDGYHDKHARAALVVITLRDQLFLVDILQLERLTSLNSQNPFDKPYLDLIIKIIKAPHLLKVVHYLEGTALRALQLALISESERNGDEQPKNYASISPCVDVALVTASLQGTSGRQCKELPGLAWNFLRQDLCVAEHLSNFERRPLRMSQEHYALSLAWCPVVILRACCSYDLVSREMVRDLAFKADGDWVSKRMDEAMHKENFGDGSGLGGLEDQDALPGNFWETEKEVEWSNEWKSDLQKKETEKEVEWSNEWKSDLQKKEEDVGGDYYVLSCRGQKLLKQNGDLVNQEGTTITNEDFPLKVVFESQAVRKFRLENAAREERNKVANEMFQRSYQKGCYPPGEMLRIVEPLFDKKMAEWELKVLHARQEQYQPPWRRAL